MSPAEAAKLSTALRAVVEVKNALYMILSKDSTERTHKLARVALDQANVVDDAIQESLDADYTGRLESSLADLALKAREEARGSDIPSGTVLCAGAPITTEKTK